MNSRRFFCKIMPAFAAGIFIFSAGIIFTVKYVFTGGSLPHFFGLEDSENRLLFYLNFYFYFAVYIIATYGCLFLSGFFFRGFCLLAGFLGAVIAVYVLNDFYTINLPIYSAFILICAVSFSPPKNYILSGFSILLFIAFLFHPSFFGSANIDTEYFTPSPETIVILVLCMSTLSVGAVIIRHLSEKYDDTLAEVSHLNQVGTKMLLFNHRLQEYVKNFGEEAVKKDRIRFTSDLHDASGYVFTNIIAISDAAMSWPSMETQKVRETFQLIQNQARNGLRQTREALYMIREIQDPVSGSIETIYEMKAILEEVTSIRVDIEYGNMHYNYGRTVNRVITRIVQEAFTNTVRHGQASQIKISFWELTNILTMTVRDNGVGAQNIVKGIGLAGMEERVAQVNGTLEVYSPEDGGFCLKVTIPLQNVHFTDSGAING